MQRFFVQLGWELRKLLARPQCYVGFAAILIAELLISALLRVPAVRVAIARHVWKMQWRFDEVFSGLTTASHMLGEVMTVLGALSVALVAGDIVARERESGTFRMLFSRPVSRGAVLLQKGLVCAAYTIVLTAFCGLSALLVGVLFEGKGPLVMIAPHEGVLGSFDYTEGLHRYTLAVGLFAYCALSGMLLALAFSCCNLPPAAAAALAMGVLFADTSIRTAPQLGSIAPYCLTTRLLAWRQVFNDDIPWPRIQRQLRDLLWWDLACAGAAYAAFRRCEFTG